MLINGQKKTLKYFNHLKSIYKNEPKINKKIKSKLPKIEKIKTDKTIFFVFLKITRETIKNKNNKKIEVPKSLGQAM